MSYFFVLFNEIKLRKIPLIFDVEKRLWKSELCCFRPSILKWWKGQKYFYGRFHMLWSCLFTTKLSCLQKKKDFGHTIAVLNIYLLLRALTKSMLTMRSYVSFLDLLPFFPFTLMHSILLWQWDIRALCLLCWTGLWAVYIFLHRPSR